MATNAPAVASVTLQKFIDACVASVKRRDGTNPAAAPNAFKDAAGDVITLSETSDFEVVLRTNPGGQSAWIKIIPNGSRALSIQGEVDLTVLATKLV